MKSFSQKQHEDEAWGRVQTELAKERRDKRQAELDAIRARNIPPRPNLPEAYIPMLQRGLVLDELPGVNLACDHCGTELVDRDPGRQLASMPSRKTVACPGCGWTGSMRT